MENPDNKQVRFEEEEVLVDRASLISLRTAITSLVLKLGLAKTEVQANYVLIGVLVVSLLATLFVISRYLI